MNRLRTDPEMTVNLADTILDTLGAIATCALAIFLIGRISGTAALAITIPLLLVVGVGLAGGSALRRRRMIAREAEAHVSHVLADLADGVLTLQLGGGVPSALRRLDVALHRRAVADMRVYVIGEGLALAGLGRSRHRHRDRGRHDRPCAGCRYGGCRRPGAGRRHRRRAGLPAAHRVAADRARQEHRGVLRPDGGAAAVDDVARVAGAGDQPLHARAVLRRPRAACLSGAANAAPHRRCSKRAGWSPCTPVVVGWLPTWSSSRTRSWSSPARSARASRRCCARSSGCTRCWPGRCRGTASSCEDPLSSPQVAYVPQVPRLCSEPLRDAVLLGLLA